jgi:hypothetical protein
MMVMLGARYRPITLKIRLGWALEQQNALDICVVRRIFVLYFSVFLQVMKFLKVVIVCNLQYMGSVL